MVVLAYVKRDVVLFREGEGGTTEVKITGGPPSKYAKAPTYKIEGRVPGSNASVYIEDTDNFGGVDEGIDAPTIPRLQEH